ncbi:MAG TPA: GTPase ObgE [Dehalococcoidales bacterium]|nr:GTPase ObgE [Dehalococcoidales bacterium]
MLDKVELRVKAGDGGRGAVAFRREKFIPYGGPFGGDGGRGGDVIIRALTSVSTLRAYQRKRNFRAENGGHGMTKNKHGANGLGVVLNVPPGTLVYHKDNQDELIFLADLKEEGQEVVVARGGNGGYGNSHYATATNQAPRIAQPGIPGQEKIVVLEMRMIADAGIVGYPNVGKSSLLAALSKATPEIADYPFTTLEPQLGVVKTAENHQFILAEIPGLIEGAHKGRGLGHSFLKHAMRTRVILHLLDGSSAAPLEDMFKVNNELAAFDATLTKRPQVVAINKIDLPQVRERRAELERVFAEAEVTPHFISAASGEGLAELVQAVWVVIEESESRTDLPAETVPQVFRPKPAYSGAKVQRRSGGYILVDPVIEKMLDRLDMNNPDDLREFNQTLERLGINKTLKSAGARSGDTVKTGNMEWTWIDDHEKDRRRTDSPPGD